MGEIIFGSVAAICLCAFVGVGCWVLVQKWMSEEYAERRKREDALDYLSDLNDQNTMMSIQIRNEILRRKMKELGITYVFQPEEDEKD